MPSLTWLVLYECIRQRADFEEQNLFGHLLAYHFIEVCFGLLARGPVVHFKSYPYQSNFGSKPRSPIIAATPRAPRKKRHFKNDQQNDDDDIQTPMCFILLVKSTFSSLNLIGMITYPNNFLTAHSGQHEAQKTLHHGCLGNEQTSFSSRVTD